MSEEDEKERGGSDSWSAEQWHVVKKGDTLWKIAEAVLWRWKPLHEDIRSES